MSRPLYETSANLSNEQSVAGLIEKRWNVKLQKLPISYKVDFCAVRGKEVVAWMEIKCRNHPAGQYPTLMLSVLKWQAGIQLHQSTSAPLFLVARFACGTILYAEAILTDVEVEYGGRTAQTRDSADVEPVVMIPVKAMKEIVWK